MGGFLVNYKINYFSDYSLLFSLEILLSNETFYLYFISTSSPFCICR